MPQFIEHGRSIQTLVDNGTIVIASGGGGIPTFWNDNQKLEGIDAVIDKDLSAALLGRVIKSSELWIITDLDQAYLNFGKEDQEPILNINQDTAKQYFYEGHFKAGSMGPKIQAALYFLKYHGEKAVITSINGIDGAITGKNGTTITK